MSPPDVAARTPAPGAALLATKLHQPTPRATAVSRPRLSARLLAGLRARLTLVAAPAGFGKSTLLAQALHGARDAAGTPLRVGWVALDAGDGDPARFWTYVCTALERAAPGAGAPALAVLRADPTAVDAALAELLNALAEQEGPVALVLDDYHAIAGPAVHGHVAFLLDHAPPQLHVVIAGRIDPPLPLARWRARGELVELRAADLRFTPDEALEFLCDTMGLQLDAAAAAALEARTEGWAAGLQLAALSLQGHSDPQRFIASFGGSHRHVVDYLVAEVLQRQPGHVRSFLLQTSVLERLCGPLCDAVLAVAPDDAGGDSYSRLVLDALERDNLFLIPLDDERRWYRYHHLFADLLRHRLAHEHPALSAELHRRAAGWYEQQGAVADAVDHALAARDIDAVARLLGAHGPRLTAAGETTTLQRWLDALPREWLLQRPRLALVQAWVLILNRQVFAIDPYLQAAEDALAADGAQADPRLHGELRAIRAQVAMERGSFADALALAEGALALLPEAELWARSVNGLVLGYARYVLGHTAEAIAVHEQTIGVARAAGNAVSALFSATEVVKLRVLQGRLGDARAAAERALAWTAAEGWHRLPTASALHIWLGNVLLERGELAAAGEQLALATRLTEHGPGITSARARTFSARLLLLQGERARALQALDSVESICQRWEPGGERAFFGAYVARLRLLAGEADAARRWAATCAPWVEDEMPSFFRELELLTLARVALLARPAGDDAQLARTATMLEWLRARAADAGRGAVVIEALALEALAHAAAGRQDTASERLVAALAPAAAEGFAATFVDMGEPMAELLRALARRRQADLPRPFLDRTLAMFGGAAPSDAPAVPPPPAPRTQPGALPSGETLTERELEVLRLFAAGMTSAEIAQHFVVSINTVKTQLKSIYGKLDTHSRAELVARARSLALIP